MIRLTVAVAAISLAAYGWAQRAATNYDEGKVGSYSLPDPLRLENGRTVRDASAWFQRRRPEILKLYRSEVFGRSPRRPTHLSFKMGPVGKGALGGLAIRKQVTLSFGAGPDGPRAEILIYLPSRAEKPSPVFLALGFTGNDAVNADPGILAGSEFVADPVTRNRARQVNPASRRGSAASRWPVEKILTAGYGLAVINYADIEPDFDGGIRFGIRPLFFRRGQTAPAANEWGAIGAWAWGLSRAMDYLETDRDVDTKRVAVIGHSRLGKTALWAGAQDTRFSMVISNESGEGGAAISRRNFGERILDLNTSFPHWFCANFRKYNGNEAKLPVDAHMLLALIAPRPLYVASAEGDQWSDPRGEFLAVVHASPVYELLGKQGIGTEQMPAVNQPIMHTVAYHVRTGKHDITEYDWEQYLKFAAMHW